MNSLSPLTRAGLNFTSLLAVKSGRPTEKPHPGPERVWAWQCSECSDLHEFHEDAVQCCAPPGLDLQSKGDDETVMCPVCRCGCSSFRDASDCCLWHDLAAPARWRIADAVEAGSLTWTEAIERETSS